MKSVKDIEEAFHARCARLQKSSAGREMLKLSTVGALHRAG